MTQEKMGELTYNMQNYLSYYLKNIMRLLDERHALLEERLEKLSFTYIAQK